MWQQLKRTVGYKLVTCIPVTVCGDSSKLCVDDNANFLFKKNNNKHVLYSRNYAQQTCAHYVKTPNHTLRVHTNCENQTRCKPRSYTLCFFVVHIARHSAQNVRMLNIYWQIIALPREFRCIYDRSYLREINSQAKIKRLTINRV